MAPSTWGPDILWGSVSSPHLRTSPFNIRCDCHGPALLRARSCQEPVASCTHTKDVRLLGCASSAPAVLSERSPHWFSTVVISTTSIITTSQIKSHQIICNYPLIDAIFCTEKPSSTKCSRSYSSLPRGCLLVWFSSGQGWCLCSVRMKEVATVLETMCPSWQVQPCWRWRRGRLVWTFSERTWSENQKPEISSPESMISFVY